MTPSVPFQKRWKVLLGRDLGCERASQLIEQTRFRYAELLQSADPSATRSQRHRLRNLIFPGLALYQALKMNPDTRSSALFLTERLFKATLFIKERNFTATLNRLPDPFPVIRMLLKRIENGSHLEAAQEIVSDTPACFAFITKKCFILDTLNKYHAGELTRLFCKTDDWIAQSLPKVRWVRNKTLANGDDLCEFRWEKIER